MEVKDLEFIKDRLKTITRQVSNCIEISRRYLSFLRRQPDEAPRVGMNQLLTDLNHLVRVHPALARITLRFARWPMTSACGLTARMSSRSC